MCLYIDYILTKQELDKDIPEWNFYKLFIKLKGYLVTPYWNFRVDKPGVWTVKGSIESYNVSRGILESGVFHARTTEQATKPDKFFAEYFAKEKPVCVCLPISVKKEHIVAFGGQEDVGVTEFEIAEDGFIL